MKTDALRADLDHLELQKLLECNDGHYTIAEHLRDHMKRRSEGNGDLFIEESGQLRLVNKSAEQQALEKGKVECLGMTFESEDARRAHFRERLREKLADPEFRKIAGFPKGDDEAILALSDPPYFTVCPNPFLTDFVKFCNRAPSSVEVLNPRTPFASDVSEGRYAAESLAHSYHTKVPARAIVRYILHYTKPGDIVLDGFAGTGMTAIAAQLCGSLSKAERLEIEKDVPNAVWGKRNAIIADLAPAATFIAANYLHTPSVPNLDRQCDAAIEAVRRATNEYFVTRVNPDRGPCFNARIDHTVWSDVFACPNCGAELILWNIAVGADGDIDKSKIHCSSCGSELRGSDLERVPSASYDTLLDATIIRPKSVPVKIDYSFSGGRGAKTPSDEDLEILNQAERTLAAARVPIFKMLFRDGAWGDMYRSGYHAGTSHFHQFYSARNLIALSALCDAVLRPTVTWGASMLLTATAQKLSRMMRYMSDGIGRIQNGVLYFPSLFKETNPVHLLEIAKGQLVKLKREVPLSPEGAIISTSSASDLRGLPDGSVDYVFVDPPFGGNIMYSELNFLWEAWLGVFTNNEPEAIVNKKFRGKIS